MLGDGSSKASEVTAAELANLAASLEEVEGRQSIHEVLSSHGLEHGGVHLDKVDSWGISSQLVQSREGLRAVAAPRSPLVHYGQASTSYGVREVISTLQLANGASSGSSTSSSGTVHGVEILLGFNRISVHGEVTRLPVGRADLTVHVDELEGFHQADDLIDVAANRKIVHSDLAKHSSRGDDEESAEWHTVGEKNAVLVGNGLIEISDNGDLHVAQAALRARSVDPSQVSEVGVAGSSDNLSVDSTELGLAVTEGDDLSRAHKGEIQRIPEEHDPLATVVSKLQSVDVLVGEKGKG